MSDFISRQAVIDALAELEAHYEEEDGHDHLLRMAKISICALPSAQPEREKGEWTKDCACEICGFKPWYERDIHTLSFCPNCGADLRGD